MESKKYFVRATVYSKQTAIMEIEVHSDEMKEGETIEQYCHRMASSGDLDAPKFDDPEAYDYDFERLTREEMERQNSRIDRNNESLKTSYEIIGAKFPKSRKAPQYDLAGMAS